MRMPRLLEIRNRVSRLGFAVPRSTLWIKVSDTAYSPSSRSTCRKLRSFLSWRSLLPSLRWISSNFAIQYGKIDFTIFRLHIVSVKEKLTIRRVP